jgi:hypothetical protein
MRLKNIIAFIIAAFCITISVATRAQQFSYVYIQGDKQTPFYVKLEGQMQPRYGKDYSIISQLAPGVINIEILFQQNVYPPQHFAIKVPENGSRAFLLSKKGSSFSLYDLQQQFYIPAGNAPDQDHVPTYNPGENYVSTNSNPYAYSSKPTNSTYAATYNTQPANKTPKTTQNNEPRFIDNVELNNERTIQTHTEPIAETHTEDNSTEQVAEPKTEAEPEPIRNTAPKANYSTNSRCPEAISDNEFENIYDRMNNKSAGNRLKFLLSKLDNCFNTAQLRMLAKGLNNDPERYAFLKQAYPRTTDQGNFAALENLLTTREWKDYFRLIMP